MDLQFILADAKRWLRIVESWSLLDEANLIASEDGLFLRAMDPSQVAMIDFQLSALNFNECLCTNGPYRLGLDVAEFLGILRRGQANDTFEIQLNGTTKLDIHYRGQLERKFGLNLLDLGETDYPAPEINTKASITIETKIFHSIVKDAEVIADHFDFIADKKKQQFEFRASSEVKDFRTIFEKDNDYIADFKIQQESTARFNLDYVKGFTHPNLADLMKISFSDSMPLVVEYRILSNGKLRYFLAPRLEV